jgi:nucleoid-associated protein YgaU
MEENAMADDNGAQGEQGEQTYTVKAGDTLSKISKHFYGDAGKHEEIFYANRDKIEDPDNISVGTELTIPAASE